MKHVGKMKNNGAKVAIAYRTLPGDAYSALVIGTGNLGESYHDSLMTVIQSPEGQSSNELAEILSVRQFPDGSNMLAWLHARGHLKKVPTDGVLMTPTPQSSVSLDELNQIIAEQKGISIDELAISGNQPAQPKPAAPKNQIVVEEVKTTPTLTPGEMRSKADKLFKEAQVLRKQADELDPPKKKAKKETVETE
jgi:hypothetical protein